MKYFGIKTPEPNSYIWWLTASEHDSWMEFFTYPSNKRELTMYRLPLDEAIRAYKSIGYKCVELELEEKETI